ncbi:MAG: hypothetical protein ABI608_00180 [Rhizomicrobium sp.]
MADESSMVGIRPFPRPFRSLRTISGKGNGAFIVGAMFTPAYSQMAARLVASCERFALSYALHEVPTVHSSISSHGEADLAYTKPNFIHHLLKTHKKPVLYLDADCEFVAQPDLVMELVRSDCDLAIYNWLADEYADRFHPVEPEIGNFAPGQKRYFRYTGCVDFHSTSQLLCSGLTQFYRNSLSARAFLGRWHRTIAAFPGCADDHCLDFTYNNLPKHSWLSLSLKARWLPKAYARYAFWIHTKPVINHPDFPASNYSNFRQIEDPDGRQIRYLSLTDKKKTAPRLPRNCIIDIEQRSLCKLIDGKIVSIGPTEEQFWV